jgi:hypothetical protein
VTPSKYPEKWHLNVLFVVSTWLGLVAVASSILLLYLGLKSHEPDSVLKSLGGGHMTYPQIQMVRLPPDVRFCRYRFKFQSNLVWDSIKSISNFCFQF